MAQLRVFSLLGDSNVRNNLNKTAYRANPAIKAAEVLSCGHFEIFRDTLLKIRPESNVCLIACITNFMTSIDDGPSSVSQRVQPVLQDVREVLLDVVASSPDREYFLAPPMYRSNPIWYREGLPEVLTLFSQELGKGLPPNFRLLPSFATPEFDHGGVHLTSFSGLEYLLHLFDSSTDLMDRSPEPGVVAARACESTRLLEDRMMAIEQDHRRLNKVFDHKIAVDAEMDDAIKNDRFEDCFVVAGVPAISSDLVGKAWQDQAVKDVQKVIKNLMGRQMPIVFVQNSTKRYQGAEVTYTVRMTELSDSKAIRRKFGSFFLGGKGDRRPENLKGISIKNRVTPETLTRISILKLLAKRYRDSNPGAKVKVVGYESRPLFKYTPPASSKSTGTADRRPRVYNYIEAVTKLPTNFSDSEIEPILRRINPELSGKLRSIFIILSDDAFRKMLRARKQAASENMESEATGAQTGTETETVSDPSDPATDPSSSSTRKRGASSPASDASSAKK